MKKHLFFLLSVGVLIPAALCAQQKTALRLSGIAEGTTQGKVYLQKYIDRYYQVIDSATIGSDGTFRFANVVELPEIYGLSFSLSDTPFLVFLDEGDITVRLNPQHGYSHSTISGSATHDLYLAFHRERGRDLTEFIRQHPKSLVPLYILYREYVSRLSSADIQKNLSLVDESLQETNYARILRSVLATREQTDIGQQAPDFSVSDVDGNTVRLSDFTGHGYLLLDFWASWCGPCRKENPNVVQAYADYHDKGFDVLAISLDKTREAWLRGIAQDGLPYHHASELKYWNSDIARLYGIRAIPANLLLDKDGRIVAKNLRGGDLADTLHRLTAGE